MFAICMKVIWQHSWKWAILLMQAFNLPVVYCISYCGLSLLKLLSAGSTAHILRPLVMQMSWCYILVVQPQKKKQLKKLTNNNCFAVFFFLLLRYSIGKNLLLMLSVIYWWCKHTTPNNNVKWDLRGQLESNSGFNRAIEPRAKTPTRFHILWRSCSPSGSHSLTLAPPYHLQSTPAHSG